MSKKNWHTILLALLISQVILLFRASWYMSLLGILYTSVLSGNVFYRDILSHFTLLIVTNTLMFVGVLLVIAALTAFYQAKRLSGNIPKVLIGASLIVVSLFLIAAFGPDILSMGNFRPE